jgi:hypothetical protein
MRRLQAHGWRPAKPPDLPGILHFLSPEVTFSTLPVLPQVRGGRDATLTLVHPHGESRRWVLRFWDAGVRLEDDRPLWTGSLQLQRLERRLDFLTLMVPADGVPLSPALLTPALAGMHCQWFTATDPPTLMVSDRPSQPGAIRENNPC